MAGTWGRGGRGGLSGVSRRWCSWRSSTSRRRVAGRLRRTARRPWGGRRSCRRDLGRALVRELLEGFHAVGFGHCCADGFGAFACGVAGVVGEWVGDGAEASAVGGGLV